MQITFSRLLVALTLVIFVFAALGMSKPVELLDLPVDMDAALGGAALGLRIPSLFALQ